MASSATVVPGLLSVPRITTLVASLIVTLGSGSNYVYSAYAPQLGTRLHISHTRLNVIGLAGNMGVYSTAPFLGRLVDLKGPRGLLSAAFVLLLVGYLGIRQIFISGGVGDGQLHEMGFWMLVICSYMTGVGGNGGFTSAVNITAKSFPDHVRATTTAIVISGFGLSAFFFSTLSGAFFHGETSSFLLVLALGTSLPMIMGLFLIRPIPLPTSEILNGVEYGPLPVNDPDAVLGQENDTHTPLLVESEDQPRSRSIELSPSRGASPPLIHRTHRLSFAASLRVVELGDVPNVHGWGLWTSSEFWNLFVIMSLLSGTGLMYINNVGSISQALFSKGNPDYDRATAVKWQAAQVSLISITNFSGRILLGIASDFTKNTLHHPRSYCISLVSFLFILSQLLVIQTESVKNLWISSLMLGLAYGGMFGLFPVVAIEWFGMPHFSENWGTLSLAPMIGGNLFSIMFGRNLDAHASSGNDAVLAARAGLPTATECWDGKECYIASLHISLSACLLALVLSVLAGWRDKRKLAARGKTHAHAREEVVWENQPEERES